MDPLTNLPTYKDLDQQAGFDDFSMYLSVDIDSLMHLSDYYGHACGHHYVSFTAAVLRSRCPPGYPIYRVAGDEFLVLGDSSFLDKEFQKELSDILVDTSRALPREIAPKHFSASSAVGEFRAKSAKDAMAAHEKAIEAIVQAKEPLSNRAYRFQHVSTSI